MRLKLKDFLLGRAGYLLVIITSISSVLNDVVLKLSNTEIDIYLIIFFRYSVLFLYLFKYKYLEYIIKNYKNYLFRSVALFVAMVLWIKGLENSSVSSAAMYSYFEPILAYFFYNFLYANKFFYLNYLIIFAILLLTLLFGQHYMPIKSSPFNLNLFLSVNLFAIIEAINKRYVKDYNGDLICISLIISIISLPFIKSTNFSINYSFGIYALSISVLTIIMYVSLFKAYVLVDISNIVVLRYIEFPFAILIDLLIFNINFSLLEFLSSISIIVFIYFVNNFVLKLNNT
jgi:drug/metabolite transporter (DMT)-like permease